MKFLLLLTDATQQAAQTQGQGQPQPAPEGSIFGMFIPLILIFFIFWVLIIRPQKKQQREREKMISELKKNDYVVTMGGILGTVRRIKDNEVVLVIDEKKDVELRVLKSAILDIRRKSDEKEEEAAKEPAEVKKEDGKK